MCGSSLMTELNLFSSQNFVFESDRYLKAIKISDIFFTLRIFRSYNIPNSGADSSEIQILHSDLMRLFCFCFYFSISHLPRIKVKISNYLFYMFCFFLVYLQGHQLYIEYLFIHSALSLSVVVSSVRNSLSLEFERNLGAKADLTVSFSLRLSTCTLF